MKYSRECVEKAIAVTIPNVNKFKSKVPLLDLIKKAAMVLFLIGDCRYSFHQALASAVIRTALIELRETGILTYGDFCFEEFKD